MSPLLPCRDPTPAERKKYDHLFKRPIVYTPKGNIDYFATVGRRPLSLEETGILVEELEGDFTGLRTYIETFHGKKAWRDALENHIPALGLCLVEKCTPYGIFEVYRPIGTPKVYYDSGLPKDVEETINGVFGTRKLIRLLVFLRNRYSLGYSEPIEDVCSAVVSANRASASQFNTLLNAGAFQSFFSEVDGVLYRRMTSFWTGNGYAGCPPAFVVADMKRRDLEW